MSKTKRISFSRTYPAYHKRKGESTYFVEAILEELGIDWQQESYFDMLVELNPDVSLQFLRSFFQSLCFMADPKKHTIRSHERPLEVGDFITPVCWAGKPYNKTDEGYWQIVFAPDIEVKKTWAIEIHKGMEGISPIIKPNYCYGMSHVVKMALAENDGLSITDFENWFIIKNHEPISGYIICWDEKVNY